MAVSSSKYIHSDYTPVKGGAAEMTRAWAHGPTSSHIWARIVLVYLALIGPYHPVERRTSDTLEGMISLSTQILNPTVLEMSR